MSAGRETDVVPARAPRISRLSPPLRVAFTPRPIVIETAPLRIERASFARAAEPAVVLNDPAADTSNPQVTQRRMIGWIAGSIGLAGLGLGAATTGVLALKKDALDRQCADPIRICSPDGKARSGGISMGAMSAAGWALGAVGVSAGAYLVLSSNPKTGTRTALATDFYKGGAGLHVSRVW